MAVYVISDLHGMELSKLEALLEKAKFSESDWLYILGDVVDRQNDGGVEILKWLLTKTNAELILGNHEAMLLSCEFLFSEITEDSIKNLDLEKMELIMTYNQNGGEVTLKALREVLRNEPEMVADIFYYLKDAPLYEAINVGGRDFLLTHSGLGGFSENKNPEDYTFEELLWNRPNFDDSYFDDIITVFGHTPTAYFGSEYSGKILYTKTWIDIDVGISDGKSPILLRLDDMKEFSF